MRIRELDLIRYGKFTDRHISLPRRARDIHLIVGPNEAGKSTVRAAIGDWLFGIPVKTPLAFLHPMPEMRLGGILERVAADPAGDQQLAFVRAKGSKNTVRSPQDAALSDAVLQPWLAGMQLKSFQRMYALDHSTLVEGSAGILSASDDLGRLLFQSAAGIEGLGTELEGLQQEADAIWAIRKSGSRAYYQAHEAFEAAGAELKKSQLKAKDWKAQHDALLELEQRLSAARQRYAQVRQQLSQLERIRRVRPMLQALDAALAQKEELGLSEAIALLPENASSTVRECAQAIAFTQAQLQRLERDRLARQGQLEALDLDEDILRFMSDVDKLNERRLQYGSHSQEIAKLTQELRSHWERVQEHTVDLGWPADSEEQVRERMPAVPARARLTQLLKQRTDVLAQLRASQAALEDREHQVSQSKQALDRLAESQANPQLTAAFDKALKLGDHEATFSRQARAIADRKVVLQDALAGMGPFRLEPNALTDMLVPEQAIVQSLLDDTRSDHAEMQVQRKAIAKKAEELERLELELQHFVQEIQPVTREQLETARQTREQEWLRIKQAPDQLGVRATVYEQSVAKADQFADSRLHSAQHDATLRSKNERIDHLRIELTSLRAGLQALAEQEEARNRRWQSIAQSSGLPALALDVATTWLRQRTSVLEIHSEVSALERQLAELSSAGNNAASAVWAALDGAGSETPSLADCLHQARTVLNAVEQTAGQRAALSKQVADGQNGLESARKLYQSARQAFSEWETAWLLAVKAAGFDESASADRVEIELDIIEKIGQLLIAAQKIRSERLEPMQADLRNFEDSAAALAIRIAPELTGLSADAIAMELHARGAAATLAKNASRELQAQLQGIGTEIAEMELREIAVNAQLAPLLSMAGEQDVEGLAIAAEQSEHRRQFERQMKESLDSLVQGSDGLSVEQLRAEASSVAPDELIAETERLGADSSQLVEEISNLSAQQGTLRKTFESLDGADAAARAEGRRQEAVAAMVNAAESYLKLHTAARLLKWSMEKFRQTRQGPMLAKASATFNALTLGSFERLVVDSEDHSPRLFGIRPGGGLVEVSGMSEGSRDQLYLALRLAALEMQIEQGANMPLIADDLFINFDDRRTAAGLHVLGELSAKMQVVFLTHHDHLVPVARKVLGSDLNVVVL